MQVIAWESVVPGVLGIEDIVLGERRTVKSSPSMKQPMRPLWVPTVIR